MVDYFKLWIEDLVQIIKIVSNPKFDFKHAVSKTTGEVEEYPLKCEWKGFVITMLSGTRLEIAGSIHKYWNGGTNGNDFTFNDCRGAINNFCTEINLNPKLAKIINLEIGVNLNPAFDAGSIIEDIICYKNERPLRPYDKENVDWFFIEFKKGNHYLKIYDKGKQYNINNTLRVEYKEMRALGCSPNGKSTISLYDLPKKEVLQVLGSKLIQYCKKIVFTDSTIKTENLSKKEKELYIKLNNPNTWVRKKGIKPKSTPREQRNYIALIKLHGENNIYTYLESLLHRKIQELLKNGNSSVLLSKYSCNSIQLGKVRLCQTCGKDISHQKTGSIHCGEKYKGYTAARQCRNGSNNRKIKVKKIQSMGVLFDIMPFITPLPSYRHMTNTVTSN